MLGNSLNEHLLENLLVWVAEICEVWGTVVICRHKVHSKGEVQSLDPEWPWARSSGGWAGEKVICLAGASVVMGKAGPGLPPLAGHPRAGGLTPLSPFCLSPPHCFLPGFSQCP